MNRSPKPLGDQLILLQEGPCQRAEILHQPQQVAPVEQTILARVHGQRGISQKPFGAKL
jgi:hypothetical protein